MALRECEQRAKGAALLEAKLGPLVEQKRVGGRKRS